MAKKGLMPFAALLALLFFMPVASYAQPPGRPLYAPDEVIVKFREGAAIPAIDSAILRANGRLIKKFRILPLLHHIKVPPSTVEAAVKLLKSLPEVEYAEPNFLRYIDNTPDDTRYGEAWGLNNTGQTGGTLDADIDAPEAWDITTGNPGIIVADIDSGIDLSHEDLAANIYTNPGEIAGNGIDDDGNGFIDDVNGWDFAYDDNNPSDSDFACGGHGTHTAGTIGAKGNNGAGVTGVNWDVKIMPLKAFKTILIFCSASTADIINAIDYGSRMGARVFNSSYGSHSFSQAEYDAIRASKRLFAAAAGNDGLNNDVTPTYPSSYSLNNVISVAATDHNDIRASFSNYGTANVDLAAPGVGILSTTPNNTYSVYNGTSMATPHVTGSIALLMGSDPALTNNEARWMILKGVDPKGLPVATGGRLNINNTLLLPPPQVTVNVAPIGSTTVPRGGTLSYSVTLHNTALTPATVSASVVAITPNGSEVPQLSRTLTLQGNATVSQTFTRTVPGSAPLGDYQVAGRVEMTSTSYDESILAFTVAP